MNNGIRKKEAQLGSSLGKAAHTLLKDILFQFVSNAGHVCHRCGETMDRENFSIDHKENWLDSDDPAGRFFDLSNIAYSHKSCNTAHARQVRKLDPDERIRRRRARERKRYQTIPPEKRRERRRRYYLKYGR